MSPVTAMTQSEPKTTWQPSVATARRAADRASRAAAVASEWSERAGAGHAEAAEARCAGERAREAAERAARATEREEMLRYARMAVAAAQDALEADRRVSAAIAACLWAAEEMRQHQSLESAA